MSAPNQRNSSASNMNNVNQDTNDAFELLQDSQQQSNNIGENNITDAGTSYRKGRGMTTGISVEKKRRGTAKLDITIHRVRNRIVGENAKEFKTEAGVLLKQHVPLIYPKWKNIPLDIKRKLWLGLKQKFNFQDDLQVKTVIYQQLNRQYRSYRYKLHDRYLKKKGRPTTVSESDWISLIDHFENGNFKDVSGRNKQNRQKLKMGNTCGTKSIAQGCYEDRDPVTGEEPTQTASWKKSKYSNKKKNWVDEASKDAHDKIVALQSGGDGQIAMTEDEAFVEVLGPEKPHRLRGCGDGMKPPSKRGERINVELQRENEHLRRQAEDDQESIQTLKTKNEELNSRLQSLEAKLPEILQTLAQMSHAPSSNV